MSILDKIEQRVDSINTQCVELLPGEWEVYRRLARLAERVDDEMADMGAEFNHKVIASSQINDILREIRSILHPTPPAPPVPEGPWRVKYEKDPSPLIKKRWWVWKNDEPVAYFYTKEEADIEAHQNNVPWREGYAAARKGAAT